MKLFIMKKFYIILFLSSIILNNIYSQQIKQTLTIQTIERIIKYNLDIFELLYDEGINDYSFRFLQDYVIFDKPSYKWPDISAIKDYYNKAIIMETPQKVRDFFINNEFEENAFIQYVTCCFILEIIRIEKFYSEREKNNVNNIDYKIINEKLFHYERLFDSQDVELIYRYFDQFIQYTLGDRRKNT